MNNKYGAFTDLMASMTILDELGIDDEDAIIIAMGLVQYDMRRNDVISEIEKLNNVIDKLNNLVSKYKDEIDPEKYSEMAAIIDGLKMEIK